MKRKKPTKVKPKLKRQKTSIIGYQAGRELLKPQLGIELKAFDVAQTSANVVNIATPPVFNVMNAMINGAELYQRIGRKVYMKSLHFRGEIKSSGTTTQDTLRLIVVYDSNPNAVAPTLANLLQDSNAGAATTMFSEINLFNRERFQILRDLHFSLPSLTNTAGVLTNLAYEDTTGKFLVNMFIKLKGLEGVYNATNGGTIADIQTGAIGFFIFTQTTTGWNFSWQSRLRYYDP